MPFVVLIVAIVFIVVSISVLKIHPFLALILSAVLVGLLSPVPLDAGGATSDGSGQAVLALELTAREFGATAGAIGVVIVLAAIIGQCLLESGAADKITRVLLALLGEKRAPLAFLGSGYFLSIPVFFDTVFFLLIPLVRSLYLKTRRNYVLYVMAIGAGAVVTHSLVPPTPGPLIMVETLPGLELGTAIVLGFLLGLVPAVVGGLVYARLADRRLKIASDPITESSDRGASAETIRDEDLPGFWVSALPVLLPVLLISGRTLLHALHDGQVFQISDGIREVADFAGNKNFALLLATFFAMWVLKRQRNLGLTQLRDSLEHAFLMGGMIVLITSAGGALGKMLSRAGISEALEGASGGNLGTSAVFLIVLAWGLAAVIKTAQGSGTVSMITASGIMAALIGGIPTLPCNVIYVFAAIGFGSLVFSWMNDSGFWVVCKMSGFTEKETLASWTLLLFVIGVTGLIEIVVLSYFLPLN